MDKPRIRWIDASPIVHQGEEMILLRDTEGIVEQSLVVSRPTAFLLSLMDGSRTVEQIQADYQNVLGGAVEVEKIWEIIRAMDSHLFLMNDNFLRRYEEIKGEYENSPVRESSLAGRSYPADPTSLLAYLDEMLFTRKGTGDGKPEGRITGILAPHIDYERGKAVYRSIYARLKGVETPLILIFGTAHSYTEGILHISTKDFATPLGVVPVCGELCDLVRADHVLGKCVDEWPHRNEHSIELQLPILQFLAAGKRVEILPILTGSMHQYIAGARNLEEEEIAAPIQSLREILDKSGRPVLILSGADLAHIGAQFGDPPPLGTETLALSKERDQAVLEHIRNVDARGFFEEIRSEQDKRRICGLTSIYFQLKLLEGSGCEIVDYGQWTDGRSSVSFAGAVFHAAPG